MPGVRGRRGRLSCRCLGASGQRSFYALRGLRRAEALAAAVTQTRVAEGPTVIEAVVDSDHSVDTVYDCP